MDSSAIISLVFTIASIVIGVVILCLTIYQSFVSINQGTIGVMTVFGKYKRIIHPGLNFKIPYIEKVFKRVSTQNMSTELKFQAITIDQANVFFKTMLLYSVINQEENTIKNVAFKFMDGDSFNTALTRTIEGSIRGFVATKKQAEVLALRKDITHHVKTQIDQILSEWGYHLQDLQINDITFDSAIMESMSRVVASSNLKAAAENEGQALLITKTKAAEAEGNAIKIQAQSEMEAAKLRGQGVASFREEVTKGMTESAKQMREVDMDSSVIMFSMWVEAIKHFAENGEGNVIFLDGSAENMQKTMRQMMAMNNIKETTAQK
jgi:regulator of protease activity HflC (stomatin/prohibitin superfamily)